MLEEERDKWDGSFGDGLKFGWEENIFSKMSIESLLCQLQRGKCLE
jgi:hypothetical protein